MAEPTLTVTSACERTSESRPAPVAFPGPLGADPETLATTWSELASRNRERAALATNDSERRFWLFFAESQEARASLLSLASFAE